MHATAADEVWVTKGTARRQVFDARPTTQILKRIGTIGPKPGPDARCAAMSIVPNPTEISTMIKSSIGGVCPYNCGSPHCYGHGTIFVLQRNVIVYSMETLAKALSVLCVHCLSVTIPNSPSAKSMSCSNPNCTRTIRPVKVVTQAKEMYLSSDKMKLPYTNSELHELLKRVKESDVEILKKHCRIEYHPADLITNWFSYHPIFWKVNKGLGDDSSAMMNVLRPIYAMALNCASRTGKGSDASLNYLMGMLFNAGSASTVSSFSYIGFLQGKQGAIRGRLLGKRGDGTFRSVIGAHQGNAFSMILPSLCNNMENYGTVTDGFQRHFTQLAKKVTVKQVYRNGGVIGRNRRIMYYAEAGDVMVRLTLPGDLYIFTRQPSLTEGNHLAVVAELDVMRLGDNGRPVWDKELYGDVGTMSSIMFYDEYGVEVNGTDISRCHSIGIGTSNQVRIHATICDAENADFDGDEGNGSIVKTLPALIDARTCMMMWRLNSASKTGAFASIDHHNALGLFGISSAAFLPKMMDIVRTVGLWCNWKATVARVRAFNLAANYISSGNMLISLALPANFNYKTGGLQIIDGLVISGVIAPQHLKTGNGSIIHRMAVDCGVDAAATFLNSMQKVGIFFLGEYFQSFAISELLDMTEGLRDEVEVAHVEASKIVNRANAVAADDDEMRSAIDDAVKAMSYGTNAAGRKIGERIVAPGHLSALVISGAKGSTNNLAHMRVALGALAAHGANFYNSIRAQLITRPAYCQFLFDVDSTPELGFEIEKSLFEPRPDCKCKSRTSIPRLRMRAFSTSMQRRLLSTPTPEPSPYCLCSWSDRQDFKVLEASHRIIVRVRDALKKMKECDDILLKFAKHMPIYDEVKKTSYEAHRATPFFFSRDDGADGHGILTTSYWDGIRARSMIFVQIPSRNSLISRSVSTSKPGFLLRQLMHACGSIHVASDGSVRNAGCAAVIDSLNRGFDLVRPVYAKAGILPINIDKFIETHMFKGRRISFEEVSQSRMQFPMVADMKHRTFVIKMNSSAMGCCKFAAVLLDNREIALAIHIQVLSQFRSGGYGGRLLHYIATRSPTSTIIRVGSSTDHTLGFTSRGISRLKYASESGELKSIRTTIMAISELSIEAAALETEFEPLYLTNGKVEGREVDAALLAEATLDISL